MKAALIALGLLAALPALSPTTAATAQTQILRFTENDALRQAREAISDGRLEDAARHAMRLRDRLNGPRPIAARESLVLEATTLLCATERLIGDFEAAEAECDRAIALAPRDWRGYVNRGALYLESNREADALRDFERAARLAPQEPAVRINLGLARRAVAGN